MITPRFSPRLLLALSIALLATSAHVVAKDGDWFDHRGIRGSLFLVGGGPFPKELSDEFLRLAGGADAKLVVIPTAGASADEDGGAKLVEEWKKRGVADVVALHTRSRETAEGEEFVAPLRRATAVWMGGGQQSRLAAAYAGTAVESELQKLLARGGVVGGTSAGAAVQSKVMIESGGDAAVISRGFDLVPGAIIDQHFVARKRRARLLGALAKHPGLVGFGIDEGTAMILRGRQIRVRGASTVSVCLGASTPEGKPRRPAQETKLDSGDIADLTQLRRAAIARAAVPFPVESVLVPEVEKGTLVIVGGGRMPKAIVDHFVRAAGGPEALIVVVPTASGAPRRPGWDERMFRAAGAKNVVVRHAPTPSSDDFAPFLVDLAKAGGVWFGGGRQWRLVDAYAKTKIEAGFHSVLARGGVIGGSSAGASIQADYMVRGHPLGNTVMMAEGYERAFGFLRGVAIDQHFTQRNRFADLEGVVATFPQLLGIGIDEGTAIVVRGGETTGSVAEIVGDHGVHFYDRGERHSAKNGQFFDLKKRRIIDVY